MSPRNTMPYHMPWSTPCSPTHGRLTDGSPVHWNFVSHA